MIMPDILIIEDEELLQDFMSEYLQSKGFYTASAFNSKEADSILVQYTPPLIISDISMPGKNGLEYLAELRGRGLPCAVVMVTALDEHAKISEAMRLGALDYVLKPFDVKNFAKNVELWLEIGKRLQRMANETDHATIERQLRLINLFRLKCNALNKKRVA